METINSGYRVSKSKGNNIMKKELIPDLGKKYNIGIFRMYQINREGKSVEKYIKRKLKERENEKQI